MKRIVVVSNGQERAVALVADGKDGRMVILKTWYAPAGRAYEVARREAGKRGLQVYTYLDGKYIPL